MFQRMMDQVIRGMHKFASAYLEDLIIFHTTWEDHLTHLRAIALYNFHMLYNYCCTKSITGDGVELNLQNVSLQ